MSLLDSLTPREHEVLALLAEGLSDHDIARRLTIDRKTVRGHTGNIYIKLGVTNRTQAALVAVRVEVAQAKSALENIRIRISEAQKEFEALSFYLRRVVDLMRNLGD